MVKAIYIVTVIFGCVAGVFGDDSTATGVNYVGYTAFTSDSREHSDEEIDAVMDEACNEAFEGSRAASVEELLLHPRPMPQTNPYRTKYLFGKCPGCAYPKEDANMISGHKRYCVRKGEDISSNLDDWTYCYTGSRVVFCILNETEAKESVAEEAVVEEAVAEEAVAEDAENNGAEEIEDLCTPGIGASAGEVPGTGTDENCHEHNCCRSICAANSQCTFYSWTPVVGGGKGCRLYPEGDIKRITSEPWTYCRFSALAVTDCTLEDDDPWATSSEIPCCDGTTSVLADWDGDGNWHYLCKVPDCTPENDDPWATGSEIPCCDGTTSVLADWNGDENWHYLCKGCEDPSTFDVNQYWTAQITNAGASFDAGLLSQCPFDGTGEWYYDGVPTCVGSGKYDEFCIPGVKCDADGTPGFGKVQMVRVDEAVDNGGTHPDCTRTGDRMIFDGCPAVGNEGSICGDTNTGRGAVRCCSIDGTSCSTQDLGCHSDKMFSEAMDICTSNGMRLCTTTELQSGVCCGTGCNFDIELAWTSDDCSSVPCDVQISGKSDVDGIYVLDESQKYLGKPVYINSRPGGLDLYLYVGPANKAWVIGEVVGSAQFVHAWVVEVPYTPEQATKEWIPAGISAVCSNRVLRVNVPVIGALAGISIVGILVFFTRRSRRDYIRVASQV